MPYPQQTDTRLLFEGFLDTLGAGQVSGPASELLSLDLGVDYLNTQTCYWPLR
jgi:hypothetical protein